MLNLRVQRAQYVLLGLWLIFTLSLTSWWYLFSVSTLRRILEGELTTAAEIHRYFIMLTWEGGTLLASIIGGGAALVYLMIREKRERERIQRFFLTFTHELKTPLASLHLQAESLHEDLHDSPHRILVERLVADTGRLALQLENSLFVANGKEYCFFIEDIRLSALVDQLRPEWPGVALRLQGDASVRGDRRALECILRNVIQNSHTHGKASAVEISISATQRQMVTATIADNGQGSQADCKDFGKLFSRPYSGSGNGIGLFLVRELSQRMNGVATFPAGPTRSAVAGQPSESQAGTPLGFVVSITLPGSLTIP